MYPELHNVVSVDARPFNSRLERYPELIFVPGEVSEIVAILREAKRQNKQVAARCGGHSYASYGLGGKDGAWIIDVQRFNKVDIDIDGSSAFIGAGNRLGRVALQLYDRARRAIPHGLCPRVGVAGHALHGGFGFTSRNWGLALDSIEAIHVVLPDGRRIWTSTEVEPELFFSLLGAGSSFGIVTEFKMKLQRAPETCIHFWYTFGKPGELPNTDRLGKIHHGFQEFAHADIPSSLSIRFRILKNYMEVTGAFWGNEEGFNAAIAPLLKLWNDNGVPPDGSTVKTKQGIQRQGVIGESGVVERPWRDMLLYMANDDHLQQEERASMATTSPQEYIQNYGKYSVDEALISSYYPDTTPVFTEPVVELEQPGLFRGGPTDDVPDPDFPLLVQGSKSSLTDEFLATSLCIKDRITSAALFTYIHETLSPVGYNWFLLMDVYGGKNSQIKNGRNRDNSCYSFRDHMFTFQFYINIDKSYAAKSKGVARATWTEATKYLHGMRDAVMPNTHEDFKAYMCYIDPEDRLASDPTKPLPASYYYGTEQYERLKKNKEVYDPDHVLWNPQSIGAEVTKNVTLPISK